jgi:prepilin-type N-terminal cleavage/methylation domain-containing protein
VEKNLKIAGVSLIEVMISMVLISLLLMAVASVFPRMSSHRKAIQESDIAKDIANETLEYLQLYSAVPGQGCSNGGSDLSSLWQNGVVPDIVPYDHNISYERRWVAPSWYEITWYNTNGTPNPCATSGSTDGYYPVTVTVKWTKQNKKHTITVTGTVQ